MAGCSALVCLYLNSGLQGAGRGRLCVLAFFMILCEGLWNLKQFQIISRDAKLTGLYYCIYRRGREMGSIFFYVTFVKIKLLYLPDCLLYFPKTNRNAVCCCFYLCLSPVAHRKVQLVCDLLICLICCCFFFS